jgi:hypothetical protein
MKTIAHKINMTTFQLSYMSPESGMPGGIRSSRINESVYDCLMKNRRSCKNTFQLVRAQTRASISAQSIYVLQ